MSQNPYDILFEPVTIGPHTTRNRFYQVPHCNGMGHAYPHAVAEMRRIKAAGGWSVIATEECEIHPTSDVSPYVEARIWDRDDAERLRLSVDAVHSEGALAAVELAHNGHAAGNRHSRMPVMSVSAGWFGSEDTNQSYAMSKRDIANLRRWHRQAAIRARDVGFDIVYVYAGHDLCLPMHFLNRRYNRRTDEYGGSLENRVRLIRELLEDTHEAVGDRCAVAFRFATDELLGRDGININDEGHDVVAMLAELPDLWDVNVSDWENDSVTSRFAQEGYQEPYVGFVKSLTSKPVVGVGRFTSPDTMVSQVKRGVLDLIGAARPSIADPYLPEKIRQGRLDDIRECIGCNICVSGDWTMSPIRCTQNPAKGEEYRRGWHPEISKPAKKPGNVLIVGAGPAGLEAAMTLGRRGYTVALADARKQLGGRVNLEAAMPGLSAWQRVVSYRLTQLEKLPNVSCYPESDLDAEAVTALCADMDISDVVLATGARWRNDGVGRQHQHALSIRNTAVYTPDDILAGNLPSGRVVIYDDDLYYMANIIAERLIDAGCDVSFVTPAAEVASWSHNTMEQGRVEKRLLELGVPLYVKHEIADINDGCVNLNHIHHGSAAIQCDNVVLVTSREANDQLWQPLNDKLSAINVTRIGDCLAASTIAAAVYSGRHFAETIDEPENLDEVPYRREHIALNH